MLEQIQEQLQKNGTVRFRVKILPKSQKNELAGMFGDEVLKIKIAAVPAKNKANQELIKFLSGLLRVPKSNITIVSGDTSPLKTIHVRQ